MPILTVHLEKITNLADEDHIGKSDPYVKVCLVCDYFLLGRLAACDRREFCGGELLGCNCTYCPLSIMRLSRVYVELYT